MNQDDNGIPKIGCVNHDCDKCKAQQPEPLAYIRKDQLQKAAQSPMLCEVTPEPRQDRIGIYTSPPASKPWVQATTWRGLTDGQLNDLYATHHDKFGQPISAEQNGWGYERAIEAKLREKNQ